MIKKRIIGAILLVITGFTLIIILPIPLLSIKISTYDTINKNIRYPYYNLNSSKIITLNLNVEFGDIEVKYIPPPADDFIEIDVTIELKGSTLGGNTYEDFLEIGSTQTSSMVNFTLAIKSDDWFDSLLWLEQDVSIVVNVREDVVVDINTELETGNFEISVPWPVSMGKLLTIISNGNFSCNLLYCSIDGNLTGKIDQGDIFYNFDHCTIGGNITGVINEGALELKSNNVEYTKNINWMLKSNDTHVEIYQNKEMGANITGTVIIYTDDIELIYEDNSADIGAYFLFPYSDWFIPFDQPGFEYEILSHGFWYKSYDFPSKNNYNITFYHFGVVLRNHFIEIESFPN